MPDLQPIQPPFGGLPGSPGPSLPVNVLPNPALPQAPQGQVELLLFQILSQLRIQKDYTSALDEFQREKVQWNNLEEELEDKLFQLRKEKRHLESLVADLEFENQQLRKGKCNFTNTCADVSQARLENLEKQLKQAKEYSQKLQAQKNIEMDENNIKWQELQSELKEARQNLLLSDQIVTDLKNKLDQCVSLELNPDQTTYVPLKTKLVNFFSFLNKNDLDINTTLSIRNWKPLHVAAAFGEVSTIEVILEFGADVNALDESNTTSIMLAAMRGNAPAVNFLIQNNASLTIRDSFGYNVLHRAAYGGHADVINILIENTHNTLDIPTNYKEYPLHLAAYHNHTSAVEALLKGGLAVDSIDSKSRTPLHRAADRGNLEIVKLLVQYKADTAARSIGGLTALDYAQINSHRDIVDFLKAQIPNDTITNTNTIGK